MVDAGATRVWRETFAASLDISERILLSLGMEQTEAQASIKRFKDYDEELIDKQQLFYKDDEQLRQSALAAQEELELLFTNDRKLRNDKGSA
jgi:glutathione-regulated potassium-efflux system protein KefB